MRPLVLIAVTLAAAPLHAETAADVVARVQKYYDSTKDLHAKFEQQMSRAMGGKKKASGEVWLKKPGKMRWDYGKPEKKLMVSDGTTLWIYEPEDEQAFKQDMRTSTLPAQVSFLVGQGKLTDEFDISLDTLPGAGGPGTITLKLVPKTATAAYRYLHFIVDEKTGQVKQTIIRDQQDQTNDLTFSDVKQNGGVDDSRFRFAPPPGTKILSANKPAP